MRVFPPKIWVYLFFLENVEESAFHNEMILIYHLVYYKIDIFFHQTDVMYAGKYWFISAIWEPYMIYIDGLPWQATATEPNISTVMI